MRTGLMDYKEAMREARRTLESEKDRLTERMESLDGFMRMAETTEELLSQVEELSDENERLSAENERLRLKVQENDMKLTELGKLSVGVAKKSSADDVSKAIRIYLNTSKRKTQSKREAAKTVLLELITAAKLGMPEDFMETLSHFDDEELIRSQAERFRAK